jgi:hypothetical protein
MIDYLKKLHTLNVSWSLINSFQYNKEKWFDSYILDNFTGSKEMDFGKMIDKRIQKDPLFLPHLPRYEHMQYKMEAVMSGLKLKGIPDGLTLTGKKKLYDYKTGKKPWDSKRAKETGQLKFYLLLIYLTLKIKPEEFECGIHWLPTCESEDFAIEFIEENNIKTFKVKHTFQDILLFAAEIKRIYKEMELYCENRAKQSLEKVIHSPLE